MVFLTIDPGTFQGMSFLLAAIIYIVGLIFIKGKNDQRLMTLEKLTDDNKNTVTRSVEEIKNTVEKHTDATGADLKEHAHRLWVIETTMPTLVADNANFKQWSAFHENRQEIALANIDKHVEKVSTIVTDIQIKVGKLSKDEN